MIENYVLLLNFYGFMSLNIYANNSVFDEWDML